MFRLAIGLLQDVDAGNLFMDGVEWSISHFYLLVERFFSMGEGPFQWVLLTVPVMNAVVAPFVFQSLTYWAKAWDMEPEER